MMKLKNYIFIFSFLMLFVSAGLTTGEEQKENSNQQNLVKVTDPNSLSDAEMTAKAETTLAKLRDIRKYVQTLLEQARKAKDIIKVTCLNDKLTQINVNIRAYEDRMQSLANAIKIGDKAGRNHEFNVLTVLEQKITNLRMEADTCIGEAEGYLGKTEVTVTTPKGMAQMDPTTIPDIGIEIFDRPPPASAFQ